MMKKTILTILLVLFLATSSWASVNINTADAEALQALPGVGEKIAAAIVAYRTEHGPFKAVEDLTQVSGIGPKILEKIKADCEL